MARPQTPMERQLNYPVYQRREREQPLHVELDEDFDAPLPARRGGTATASPELKPITKETLLQDLDEGGFWSNNFMLGLLKSDSGVCITVS